MTDPAAALRTAIGALWNTFEHAAGEGVFDAVSRRELERHGRRVLSGIIRRGVQSGAFRPRCAVWAVQRLPFAIVAGAGASWVFGLPQRSSLSANVVTQAALEILEVNRHAETTAPELDRHPPRLAAAHAHSAYVITRERGIIQGKIVILIAQLALARKVIVTDPYDVPPTSVAALAALALALATTYWLMRDDRAGGGEGLPRPDAPPSREH